MMNKATNDMNLDWDNISRFISGEMMGEEKQAFEQTIAENPEVAKVISSSFDDMAAVGKFYEMESDFEENAAWDKQEARILEWDEAQIVKLSVKRKLVNRFSRIAAVVLLTIALGVTGYLVNERISVTQIVVSANNEEQGKTITLPDGSVVQLNMGAELSYPKTFNGSSRRVSFSGEGFFSVTRDEEQPFIVNTSNAEVTVLGTSFNLNTRDFKTEVMVSSGCVKLTNIEDITKNVLLQKGELGRLVNGTILKTTRVDENYLSWKTQQMVFRETSLSQVFQIISKTYGVDVKCATDIEEDLFLTSIFDHEPLDIILESIGKSFNLTYKKDGQKVVFSAN